MRIADPSGGWNGRSNANALVAIVRGGSAAVASNSQIALSSCCVARIDWEFGAHSRRLGPPGIGAVVTTVGLRAVGGDDHDVLGDAGGRVGSPAEGEVRAVGREHGLGVDLRAGHDGARGVRRRVEEVDVATCGIGEQAVAREPERRRDLVLREPMASAAAATTSAMMSSATPIVRSGTRGANAGRLAMSAMGSHLPAKVHDGRCRVRTAAARASVR